MTINEFLMKRLAVSEFYRQYLKDKGKTLVEASKEPLKLRDLEALERPVTLPNGCVVRPGQALCYYCLEDLIGRFNRPNKPKENDIAYMSGLMKKNFLDWSIWDLPTFVEMVMMSRVPSPYGNGMDYQLVVVDVGNVMGKVEAYDKMRPGKQVVLSPTCRERPWNPDHEHMLFDGPPHEFPSTEAAQAYWKSMPNLDNPGEKKRVQNGGALLQAYTEKVS